jgi:hypothetical protein
MLQYVQEEMEIQCILEGVGEDRWHKKTSQLHVVTTLKCMEFYLQFFTPLRVIILN